MEPGSVLVGNTCPGIIKEYHRVWGVSSRPNRNPCPQPVSLERSHLPILSENQYVVSDKSNGSRYVLFLCRVDDREHAVMIDRKLSLYQIPVAAGKSYFKGSIFDGELVTASTPSGGSVHVFLVFDVVALKGSRDVSAANLLHRLEIIRNVFDVGANEVSSPEEALVLAKAGKIVCGGSAHGLSFRAKQCFQIDRIDTLLRVMPTLPYKTDGLIFTPVHAPVKTGTHETMFKLKQQHTIDVQVSLPDGPVYVGAGGNPSTAGQRIDLQSTGLNVRFADGFWRLLPQASTGNCIVEVQLRNAASGNVSDGEAIELDFVELRRDKVHPNSLRTVMSTILNLRENILPEELIRRW